MARNAGLDFTFNEMLVLTLLREGEMYGMEIVNAAAARTSANQASIGTVYPLLKDMVRQGWLACRRTGGTPRTYYSLTDQGKAQLPLIAAQWGHVNDSVSALLGSMAAENPAALPRH
jgi:PadR family transcriptional regulator, regulatory protein PadR